MGMGNQWHPTRENLAGEPHANVASELFQSQERYRDLLNIRIKLRTELRECEREITQMERDMVIG